MIPNYIFIFSKISLVLWITSSDVFELGDISTHGIKWGGFTGWEIIHLFLPFKFWVIKEIGIPEDDDDKIMMFNWEDNWKKVNTFEDHEHYVM